MRKFLLLSLAVFTVLTTFSQDFSNKGKDFWVAYGYHQQMTNGGGGGSQEMLLYFATDQVTNITVTIPGLGWTQTYTSPGGNNIITSVQMPKFAPQDARLLTESFAPEDKGIHITADRPIVAYAHILNSSVSGATILYPTNTLGKEYYSVNYDNISNTSDANCWFYVIAADTGTTQIEITPSAATISHAANVPFTVTLTQGQVYNVMGTFTNGVNQGVDLTGSRIRSLATATGGCKRIAVFSGSGRISITCNGSSSSSDNYMLQALPQTAWGKNYLTVPAAGYNNIATGTPFSYNMYRVCVTDPTTQVFIDGVLTALPLINNFYYNIPVSNTTHSIRADKPIMVAQYLPSRSQCGNPGPAGDGDPEVIYLSSVEQSINQVTWNACRRAAINLNKHYINVVVSNKGTGISSFRLDGVPVPVSSFTTHPQDPGYSYAVLNVSGTNNAGLSGVQHTLQSDSGFNAIAYGYGSAESYGYNAGTNVRDLYQQIGVSTEYGIEGTPSVCTGAPFRFKLSLPYLADSIVWDLSNLPGPPANVTMIYSNPPVPADADSVTTVNFRQIYWYSLPTLYSFGTVGVFPVNIKVYNTANADGCGNVQQIDFDLTVSPPPVPDFTWTAGICAAEPFQFMETTPQAPKPTYRWWWDFGDPASGAANNSLARNPAHIFSAPGIYNVRYAAVTTPGCLTDTVTHQITVGPLPTATIDGTNTVCINTAAVPVIFAGAGSAAPYTFYYNITPGGSFSVNSVGATAQIMHNPNTAGTFVYTLDSVRNLGSALCVQTITGQQVTITVIPDATVVLRAGDNANPTVCINNAITVIRYDIGGSGTGGTVSGLPAGLTGIYAGGFITIQGTPTVAGTFIYTINPTGPCAFPVPALTGTITVNNDATIVLNSAAGTDNQTRCINTSITNIDYLVGGGGTGATISWAPAAPAGISFTPIGGGLFRIGGASSVSGTFNYTITTTGPCIKPTLNGTLIVTPDATLALTSAPATTNQTVCVNNIITQITYQVGGSGTGANVVFAPALPGVTGTYAAGIVTIQGTPTMSGTFTYTVTPVGPCVNPPMGGTITVNNDATIVLNSAAGTDNQTRCINTSITNIDYLVGGGGTGATISWAPATPAGISFTPIGGGLFRIAGTSSVSGTFNYTITTTGPCIKPSLTGTLTVTPNATLLLTSAPATTNQTVCVNNIITQITYQVGGSGTGANIVFTPLLPGVTGTYAGGIVTIQGTPTISGTFSYTVTPVGPCVNPPMGGTITVNNDATIVLNSAAGTDNQTRCINTAITNIDYLVGGGGTGATINWTPATPTGISLTPIGGGLFRIGGASSVSGTFNYTITTSGPCIKPSLNGTLTVTPNATLLLTSAPATTNQTVCVNNTITQITYQVGGSGTGANVVFTPLLPGVTGTYAGGIVTIQGTPTVSGTFSYTVTPVGPCVNPPLGGTITVNADATISLTSAAATANQTVCMNNAILNITYQVGGGGTGANVLFTPALPGVTGTYSGGIFTIQGSPTVTGTFNYTVATTGPCIKPSLNGTITVNPIPTASITGTTEVCQNNPVWPGVTFTGANGTAPYTFTYSVNGGANQTVTTTAGNTVAVQQTTAAAGTFIYKLLAVQDGSITACNQSINVADQTVKVNPLPTASISGSKLVCINSAPPDITFTGAGGTAPYTFTYRVNGGAPQTISSTGTNSSVSFAAPTGIAGAFNYVLESVQDGSSTACIQAQAGNATIDVSDVFPVSDFWFNDPVCLPNAVVQFQNLSSISNGTGLAFQWNFGDGSNPSSGLNPVHQYYSAGPFNATLRAISNAGCVTTKIIPLNNIHPQPKADFSINSPTGVCIGTDVTLTDQSNGMDGVISQWNWNLGDGTTRTTNTVTYRYTDTLTYNISLYTVNSFGCNSDTIIKPFTVHPFPKVSAGPDRFILEGGQITLLPVVYGNDLQFLWTPDLYLIDNKVEKVKVNRPLTDMTYTLKVTARGGCSFTDDVFIKLLKFPKIPNTFTPNNDNIHDTWVIEYLNTYPDNRVQVFTRTGQLVFESRGYNTPWDGTIKGKPLPFDTYYYIIEPGNGRDPITGYVTIIK